MGRAYEVRKASIQKTGAVKAKLYTNYAKEIYLAAKKGSLDVESNISLKRLVEKAKKEQVPSDIINRAIEKVNSGGDEAYTEVNYEIFGGAGSTAIIACLTDNVNRTVSELRAVVNKCHIKMGSVGSVSYNYDNLCVVGFKGLSIDETLNALILDDIDVIDIEEDDDVVIYGDPQDLFKIKECITKVLPNVVFDMDEITMLAKEKVELIGEDLDLFRKLLVMLDDVEDVSNVYHNVSNV